MAEASNRKRDGSLGEGVIVLFPDGTRGSAAVNTAHQ